MKDFLRILVATGSAIVLSAIPSIVEAACPFTMLVNGPAVVNVDPTLPVGTSLWSASVTVNESSSIACIGGYATLTYNGVGARENTYFTYPTSVPGVGIRLKYLTGSMNNGAWFPWSYTSTWTGGYIQTHTIFVEFIKTGPITVAGSLSGVFSTWNTNLADNPVWGQYAWAAPVVFNVAVPTCAVTTHDIAVSMGSVAATSFGGAGSVSDSKPFNISLQCSGGVINSYTNVYTTLTDVTNPGNVSDTLSLNASSSATGLGVQVLRGTTVIRYGPDSSVAGNPNQWFAGAAQNGAFNIPLTARYIKTAATVTPGTANASATFTMSYQ